MVMNGLVLLIAFLLASSFGTIVVVGVIAWGRLRWRFSFFLDLPCFFAEPPLSLVAAICLRCLRFFLAARLAVCSSCGGEDVDVSVIVDRWLMCRVQVVGQRWREFPQEVKK